MTENKIILKFFFTEINLSTKVLTFRITAVKNALSKTTE